jgi:hypothetical protein
MTINEALIIFNSIIAWVTTSYMLYYGIRVYSNHSPIRRIVYIVIGLALLYQLLAYMMALAGWFPYVEVRTEKLEYSTLIRPIVSIYLMAPVALDIIQRKYGGLK